MKLSEELKWRGFWNQTTFQDESILDNQKHTTFFVEEKERKIVESVGFNFITKYELYTISLTD